MSGKKKSTGYKSEFRGTKRAETDIGGLATGGTYRNRAGTMVNYSRLSPAMQPLQNTFLQGSINNSEVLAQSPAQRIADIEAGNNRFYNVSNQIATDQLNTNLNNNFQAMQDRGLGNSTITGGIQGQLLSDAQLNNQRLQLGALQGENALAANNFGTMFGGLGDLAQLQFAAGNAANANYLQAKAAIDANKQFNENYQAANPGRSVLGTIGNAATGALAGFATGGPVGAVLGGVGGAFGSGGGGQAVPMPGQTSSMFQNQSMGQQLQPFGSFMKNYQPPQQLNYNMGGSNPFLGTTI